MLSRGFLRKSVINGRLGIDIMANTVLITGAAGFIGSALAQSLCGSRLKVIATYRRKSLGNKKIKNNNLTFIRLDLTHKNDFRVIPKKVDTVVHLASLTFRVHREDSFRGFFKNNVLGTCNLLEFCKERQVKRIIYISTKFVYGIPMTKKVDERYLAQPGGRFFYYALSKLFGEYLCQRYSRNFGIESVIFRVAPVFGPGQPDSFLIPRLIKKVRNNEGITLYNNGDSIMEYLYLDDCVKIIGDALKNNCSGVYNIGSGRSLSLEEIIGQIIKVFSANRPVKVNFEQKPNCIAEKGFILNINKAKEELGFRPVYNFKDGLKKIKTIKEGIVVE